MSRVDDAARAAASAVHDRVGRHIDWTTRAVELGIITAVTNPLQVEMQKSRLTLEEGNHLALSQFVRWWDMNYQLQVGDALVMVVLPDESWLAFDVRSSRDVNAGIRPSRPPATATGDMRPAQTASETDLLSASASAVGVDGGTPIITLAWAHHIVRKLEVYDADGVRLGFVPVFESLPA